MLRVNDCKTRWAMVCPNTSVGVVGCYDHMTGRLDLEPEWESLGTATRREQGMAYAFCNRLSINYFYFSEVRDALIEAGVDPDDLPF